MQNVPITPIPARPALAKRLFSLRGATLLIRNTVVSTGAFAIGLLLMWGLVQGFGVDEYIAAALSFLVANSFHYLFGRLWIFAGTGRGIGAGYLYFFINAGIGLAVTMALFALFAEVAGLHYLLARIVASLFAGLTMFALNAVLNFKSL